MLFQKEKEDKNQINRLDQKRERRSRRAFFLLSPISRKTLSGKVSLCTFLKKASLTLETAMALLLFFFGVLTLLSFMDIYKVQTEHLTGLCQKAKEAGMYAYGAGGSGTETITLPDVYSYQPIGGLIPLPTVSRIHAKIRKREGAYYLADLNSRNGTSVNGQLLKTGEDYLLEDEDEVDFAQARYIFLK